MSGNMLEALMPAILLQSLGKGGGGKGSYGTNFNREKASDGREICRRYSQTQECSWGTSCRFAHINSSGAIVNPTTPAGTTQPVVTTVTTGGTQELKDGLINISNNTSGADGKPLVEQVRAQVKGHRVDPRGLYGSAKGVEFVGCTTAVILSRLIRRDENNKLINEIGPYPQECFHETCVLLEHLHTHATIHGKPLGREGLREILEELITKLQQMGIKKIEGYPDEEPDTEPDSKQGLTELLSGVETILSKKCGEISKTLDTKINSLEKQVQNSKNSDTASVASGDSYSHGLRPRKTPRSTADGGGQFTLDFSRSALFSSGAVASVGEPPVPPVFKFGPAPRYNPMDIDTRPLLQRAPRQLKARSLASSSSSGICASVGDIDTDDEDMGVAMDGHKMGASQASIILAMQQERTAREARDEKTRRQMAERAEELERLKKIAADRECERMQKERLERERLEREQLDRQRIARDNERAELEARREFELHQATLEREREMKQMEDAVLEQQRMDELQAKRTYVMQVLEDGETAYANAPGKSNGPALNHEIPEQGLPDGCKGHVLPGEEAIYVNLNKESSIAWAQSHTMEVLQSSPALFRDIMIAWKQVTRPGERIALLLHTWGLNWEGQQKRSHLCLTLAIAVTYHQMKRAAEVAAEHARDEGGAVPR